MSEREAFERQFPMPDGVVFNDSMGRYQAGVYSEPSVSKYNLMWEAWQARAQDQVEVVVERLPFGAASAYSDAKESGKTNMEISCELVVELVDALERVLDTHPAKPESAAYYDGYGNGYHDGKNDLPYEPNQEPHPAQGREQNYPARFSRDRFNQWLEQSDEFVPDEDVATWFNVIEDFLQWNVSNPPQPQSSGEDEREKG